MIEADVVVIGGGIAGVSAAYHLAPSQRVVLLEAEATLAYHTTGRSAAQFLENYGGEVNERLTRASRAFFTNPPAGLVDHPLVSPCPLLTIGTDGELDRAGALELCPVLRPEAFTRADVERDACDIDVMALHQAFVRGARRAGGEIVTGARVERIQRRGERWQLDTAAGPVEAGVLVNAAGAWGDQIAALAGVRPVGLTPLRRTAFTVPAPPGSEHWPLVYAADDTFYFKPEGREQLLCSLADETPSPPCDARPEEADVALAIERINAATTLDIRHVRQAWAGLRSFVADRHPVIGFDTDAPGFFWMVGQGGAGIQTAPAAGALVAAGIGGDDLPPDLAPARPALRA